MSEGRFNINLLDQASGDGSDADFIALVGGVPKRYMLSIPGGSESGTTLPVSPEEGDSFVLTQDDGANAEGFYICVTAGAWTQIASGGAAPAETIITVFERGVTLKPDNTELNLGGGDDLTLPTGWKTMKRLTINSEQVITINMQTTTISSTTNFSIPELIRMYDTDGNVTFTTNVSMVFNPFTGVFPSNATNANIDYVLLAG